MPFLVLGIKRNITSLSRFYIVNESDMEDIDNEVNISQVCFDICRAANNFRFKTGSFPKSSSWTENSCQKEIKKTVGQCETYIYIPYVINYRSTSNKLFIFRLNFYLDRIMHQVMHSE